MKNTPFYLIIVSVFLTLDGRTQTYDQLKMQLQFENFYGTRLKSNKPNDNISGSEYLFDNWVSMEVYFKEGTARFDQGKLNLRQSGVEVVYKGKEMFISPTNFNYVKILDRDKIFVPGNKYIYNDVILMGIVELFKEEMTLPYILLQHYVYVKAPSPNLYVSGGSSEHKLMKSSAIFLNDGTKLVSIKGRKSIRKYYKNHKNAFEKAEETSEVNFKDPESLQKFIDKIEVLKKS